MDKIKVGLTFPHNNRPSHPDYARQRDDYGGVMSWVGSARSGDFNGMGKRPARVHSVRKPAALTIAKVPIGGGTLYVSYGKHTGMHRAWLEFNPDKYDLDDLTVLFNLMLSHGFETIYQYGGLTYLELFVDVDGEEYEDYQFLAPNFRVWDDRYAAMGTIDLGSDDGRRYFSIYDKAKEQCERAGRILPTSRLRIEARLRGSPVCAMADLVNQPCPFNQLLVVPREELVAGKEPVIERLCACGPPLQAAYWKLGAEYRSTAVTLLSARQPSWWRPQEMWAGFGESLSWLPLLRYAGQTGGFCVPKQSLC